MNETIFINSMIIVKIVEMVQHIFHHRHHHIIYLSASKNYSLSLHRNFEVESVSNTQSKSDYY
jgi:hypothetical protein